MHKPEFTRQNNINQLKKAKEFLARPNVPTNQV